MRHIQFRIAAFAIFSTLLITNSVSARQSGGISPQLFSGLNVSTTACPFGGSDDEWSNYKIDCWITAPSEWYEQTTRIIHTNLLAADTVLHIDALDHVDLDLLHQVVRFGFVWEGTPIFLLLHGIEIDFEPRLLVITGTPYANDARPSEKPTYDEFFSLFPSSHPLAKVTYIARDTPLLGTGDIPHPIIELDPLEVERLFPPRSSDDINSFIVLALVTGDRIVEVLRVVKCDGSLEVCGESLGESLVGAKVALGEIWGMQLYYDETFFVIDMDFPADDISRPAN